MRGCTKTKGTGRMVEVVEEGVRVEDLESQIEELKQQVIKQNRVINSLIKEEGRKVGSIKKNVHHAANN